MEIRPKEPISSERQAETFYFGPKMAIRGVEQLQKQRPYGHDVGLWVGSRFRARRCVSRLCQKTGSTTRAAPPRRRSRRRSLDLRWVCRGVGGRSVDDDRTRRRPGLHRACRARPQALGAIARRRLGAAPGVGRRASPRGGRSRVRASVVRRGVHQLRPPRRRVRPRALPEDACSTANRLTCLHRHGFDRLDRDARRPCGDGLGGLVFLDLRRAGGLTDHSEGEAPDELIQIVPYGKDARTGRKIEDRGWRIEDRTDTR